MAVFKVYNGTSWITVIAKAWSGSTWIEKLNFWNGSAWIPLYPTAPPLAINVLPSSFFDVDQNCPLDSQLISANASGGTPSYSYAWSFTAGGGGMTILSPTSASTRIRVTSGGFKSGTLQCIVTDQVPNNVSDTCAASMECGGL